MPSVFSFPFSDGTWSMTPSCPIVWLLGGGRGASDGWGLCTWLRGAVTSTVPCHLPASTVTCVRGPPGFPPPLSTPRALLGILPLGDSPCAQAGAWKQPSGRAHALTLTAGPALPCRRSFPSWLCPPRWPRASRSWTPIPAWGEHGQGPWPSPGDAKEGSGSGEGPSQGGHPRWKDDQAGKNVWAGNSVRAGNSVQVSEGGQACKGVGLSEDEGEIEETGGDGEGGGPPAQSLQRGVRGCGSPGPLGAVSTGRPWR